MISVLLFDCSRTLLFPKDKEYKGGLNKLAEELQDQGNYEFSKTFYINEELLEFLSPLKEKYRLFIFTTGTVQNAPECRTKLDSIFEKILIAEDLNVSKDSPEAYKDVCQLIEARPEEVLFIDDQLSNIEAAKIAGLNTLQYLSNEKLFQDIDLRLAK